MPSEVVRYMPPKQPVLVRVRKHSDPVDQAVEVEMDGSALPPLVYEYNGALHVVGSPHQEWTRERKSYVVGQRTTREGVPIEGASVRGMREEWRPTTAEDAKVANKYKTDGNNVRMMDIREYRHLQGRQGQVQIPVNSSWLRSVCDETHRGQFPENEAMFIFPLSIRDISGEKIECLKPFRDFNASMAIETQTAVREAQKRLDHIKMTSDAHLQAAEEASRRAIADRKAELAQKEEAELQQAANEHNISMEQLKALKAQIRSSGKAKASPAVGG